MNFTLYPEKNNLQLLSSDTEFNIANPLANLQNKYMNIKSSNNISNSQCEFNTPTLLKYTEGKILLKMRLKVSATKTVKNPTVGGGNAVTATGSSPYVLSIDNYTVVPGTINNMLTKLQITTSKQSFLYENTTDRAQVILKNKITMMQYDQQHLNDEFKLHIDQDIEPTFAYSSIIGNGSTEQSQIFPNYLDVYGSRSNTQKDLKWLIDRNMTYSILDRAQQLNVANYSSGGVPLAEAVSMNNTGINGYGEFSSTDDTFKTGAAIIQTAFIDVYEYISCPFLTTDYSRDQMQKIMITDNGTVAMTLNYDSSLVSACVKVASDVVINSIEVVECEIKNLHTFNTLAYKQQQINSSSNTSQALCYNFGASLTPSKSLMNVTVVATANGNTSNEVNFTLANQFSVPKYLLLACPAKQYTGKSNNYRSDLIYAEIENIKLEINSGTSTNVLQYYDRNQLELMTSEVLHNDKFWYRYIGGKDWMNKKAVSTVLNQGALGTIDKFISCAKNVYATDTSGYAPMRRQKLNFFILDLSKIPLGTIEGMSLRPNVLYNTPFSYSVTMNVNEQISQFDYPQLAMWNTVASGTYPSALGCIPICMPISLMLGRVNNTGSFEMVPVLQSFENYSTQYLDFLESYKTTIHNKLFLGGKIASGFFSDLWGDIKSGVSDVANVVEKVVPIADAVASHFGGTRSKRYKRIL